jgi:hypothetical protein
MSRWLILIATFAAWVLCMVAVYVHCRPAEVREPVRGLEAGLDVLFDERNEVRRVWRVYVDLQRLKKSARRETVAPWSGENETSLVEVGWLESTLKKRDRDETRLEYITEAALAIPHGADLPLFELMGELHYQSRADVSRDNGLEVLSATFSMGLGVEVQTHGVREGSELKVRRQVFRDGKKMLDDQSSIAVGAKGAPLLDLFPFQQNAGVNDGYTWDITMLDMSIADVETSSQPRLVGLKVTCTGRQRIMYDGAEVSSFTVSSADGKARAWYSADGVVLKQAYTIGDVLDVMIVRVPPDKLPRGPRRPLPLFGGGRIPR